MFSLECFSCETLKRQAFLFSSFFFFSHVRAKRDLWSQAFLAETVETGNKNREVSQRHALLCEEGLRIIDAKDVELFHNGSVH